MAGVWVWCEIVCRHCAGTTGGQSISGSRIPKRDMIKYIKEFGWVIDGQDAFCSEECHKHEKGTIK